MDIISKIKEKPELKGIADSLVEEKLSKVLKKYPLSLSEKNEKLIIKETRALLRKNVGQYQIKTTKRTKLFKEKNWSELLYTHTSTKERAPHYLELKQKINTFKPLSILDLGCGLNPLALATPTIPYHASDVNESDLSIVKAYFKEKNLKGSVFSFDLRNQDPSTLPQADICLLFKLFDALEQTSHKLAEQLITKIPTQRFLISFALIKLSGKPMNVPNRPWLEHLLRKHNLPYSSFIIGNELFYYVEKRKDL
ncbi:MAG TPA: hypothetical protein VJK51_00310 [Candidatus Nanoarchaeia archaeon]|nr:hypothetical protein [Candidatus Nanoarchaeia archaeon]